MPPNPKYNPRKAAAPAAAPAAAASPPTPETKTRNIVFTPDLDRFVVELVKKSGYLNASEVVREALREMRERRRRRGLYMHRLHLALSHGVIELDQGESAEVKSEEELDSFLKRIVFRSLRGARFQATSRAHRFMPRDRRRTMMTRSGLTLPPEEGEGES